MSFNYVSNSFTYFEVEEIRQGLFRLYCNLDELSYYSQLSFDPFVNLSVKSRVNFELCGSQSGQKYVFESNRLDVKKSKECRRIDNEPQYYLKINVMKNVTHQVSEVFPLRLRPVNVWITRQLLSRPGLDKAVQLSQTNYATWSTSKKVAYDANGFFLWMDFGLDTISKSILKRNTDLFTSQTQCDVEFQLKDDKKVGAHLFILSAGSSIFADMFDTGRLLEDQSRRVMIDDFEMDVFKQLLIYLYSGVAPKMEDPNITQSLFEAADKYGVEMLKQECIDLLVMRLKTDNAINMLIWSDFHSVLKLMEASTKYIASIKHEIFLLPEWIDFKKNFPDLYSKVIAETEHFVPLWLMESNFSPENSDCE